MNNGFLSFLFSCNTNFWKKDFFLRLKDFWGDAAIGIFKKLSARKCPKIRFFSVFFNSYLMILNISAAELNRNNMRNSSE